MKRYFILILLLFYAAFPLSAQSQICFSTKNVGASFLPKVISSECRITDRSVPGTERSALAVFRGAGCRSVEIWFRKPILLPENDAFEFTLKGCLLKGHGSKQVILRLRDFENQLVQCYAKPLPSGKDPAFVRKFRFSASAWNKRLNKQLKLPLRITSIYVECDSQAVAGEFYLESLEYIIDGEQPSVSMKTDCNINLFLSPDRVPALVLKNSGTRNSRLTGNIQVLDVDSRPFSAQKVDVEVPAGSCMTLPLGGTFNRWGFWYVDYDFSYADAKKLSGRIPFGKMLPAEKAADKEFIFGIAGGTGRLGWEPHRILGINGIRVNAGWNHIQPERDVWKWEGHDKMFRSRNKEGIASLYIITPPAAWGMDVHEKEKRHNPRIKGKQRLPDMEAYKTFLEHFVTRYKGKVEFYVVGNEPDLVGMWNYSEREYLDYLKLTHEIISRIDSEAKVMNGGISSIFSQEPYVVDRARCHPTVMKQMLEEGNLDIFCYHGHGPADSYWRSLKTLCERGIFKKYPWYSGETGISLRDSAAQLESGRPVNSITIRKKHAETILEKVAIAKAFGARGYTLWCLWNSPRADDDPEKYGILDPDGSPYPAFLTYGTAIRQLQGTTPDRIFSGDPLYILGFRREPGSYLLVLWNNNTALPEQPLWLHNITGTVEKIDMFGNITPLEVQAGVLPLLVGSEPFFLKLKRQNDVPTVLPMVAITSASIRNNDSSTVVLEFSNPLAGELPIWLKFSYPEGLQGTASDRAVIPGLEKSAFQIKLAADGDYNSDPNSPKGLTVTVTPGKEAPLEFFVPVIRKLVLKRQADNSEPQFVLDQPSQLFSYAISGPEQDLMWKGPDDLSAEIWLAAEADRLEVSAMVKDDKHHQPYHGRKIWNGDSIQVAVKLPNQKRAWEFGLASLPDGKTEVVCFSRANAKWDFNELANRITGQATRIESKNMTEYRLVIPFDLIGMTAADKQTGISFNLMVNDNDGFKRENCIMIAPSLNTNKDATKYPVICFE